MDKNNKKTNDSFVEPSDAIQEQITSLMGLPSEEASPTMTKFDEPNVAPKKNVKINEPITGNEQEVATAKPESPTEAAIESIETDRAVSEIIKHDSDKILEEQDTKKDNLIIKPKEPKGLSKIFRAWWGNKLVRNGTFLIVMVGLVGLFAIPNSRYATLNAVGVRSEMSFIVADKISGRPVKNVEVTIADVSGKSSEAGLVELSGLKLGETELTLTKRSFEQQSIPIIVGWGTNPFDAPFEIVPTGTTFSFSVSDWLDGEIIGQAVVSDGESEGISNEEGVANLTIEPTDEDLIITIAADGYRQETVTIPADSSAPQSIKMVSSAPDVFISKRSGKYDVYVRDLDGKNEELILPATGSEQPSTHVLTKFDDTNLAALVSSRAGERNSEGYILSDLYIVDINGKTASKIEFTESERLRLVGWSGDSIIFVKSIAGPSGGFGNRQRVIAYNTKKDELKELATANYFNDVRIINNQIYYVVSSGTEGSQSKGLGRIKADGTERVALLGDDVYGVYRSAKNELVLNAANNKWYKINIDTKNIVVLEGEPAQLQDIRFSVSPDGKNLARIEVRDGKSVLLVKNLEDNKEQEVLRQSGISYPLTWVNNKSMMFVINTSDETASYVVSTKNNKPVKIGDITASIYDQTYFY